MKRGPICAIVLLCLFGGLRSFAQSEFGKAISLRESFQNKIDKADPAVISFTDPKGKEASWLLKAALGVNLEKLLKLDFALEPYVEYQRNTLVEKEQDNWQTGVALEWQMFPWTKYGWALRMVSAAKYNEDRVKEVSSLQANIYFTPVTRDKDGNWRYFWLPNTDSDFGKVFSFSYTPYVGFENENRIQTTDGIDEGNIYRLLGRISASISLLPKAKDRWKNRIQFTVDYHYRWNFKEDVESLSDEVQEFFTASVNYKFYSEDEGKREAMIGFDYVNGANPTKNFEDQSYYALALKVKL